MIKKLSVLTIVMMTLFLTITVFPASAAASWTFGVSDPDDASVTMNPPSTLNSQGINNFYFYYSKEYNVGGKVKSAALKESTYAVNKNSYGKRSFVPALDDVNNYINNIWPTLGENGNPQFWWRTDSLGYTCPAGNMTNVVAFRAPVAGAYEIDAKCFGGAKDDQGYISDKADGVSFAVNQGDKNLWSKNTGKTIKKASEAYAVPKQTVNLNANEMIYFVTDPNNTFQNDLGHWFITVTQKSVQGGNTSSGSKTASSSITNKSSIASVSSKKESSVGTTSGQSEISQSSDNTSKGVISQAQTENSTTAASSKSDKGSGSNTWIVLAAIGVLAVIGIGAVTFYFLRKTHNSKNNS